MEDRLIRALKQRGRLMLIAGRFNVNYTFNLGQAHEINIRQNTGYDRDDLANVCRLVRRGLVRIAPLLHDVVPADRRPAHLRHPARQPPSAPGHRVRLAIVRPTVVRPAAVRLPIARRTR